ncbi:hypothetical protein P7C70_g2270, partial [Phenoliferia sp. Uapishka_3]
MSTLPQVTNEQRINGYDDKHLQPRAYDDVLESQQPSPRTARQGGLSRNAWIWIVVGGVLALAAIVGGAVGGTRHKSKSSFSAPFAIIPPNNSTSFYLKIASITLMVPVATDSQSRTHFSAFTTTVQLQPTLSPVETASRSGTAFVTKFVTAFECFQTFLLVLNRLPDDWKPLAASFYASFLEEIIPLP